MALKLVEIRTEIGTLDLYEGAEEEFYVTRQIHDLTDFETRNADYSKTIRIPPTPRNLLILDTFNSDPETESNTIPCQILMGGITIAHNATLLFTGTTIDNETVHYDVTVLYGNFNLFNEIIAGTIDEINWADLIFDYTHENYAAKSANTTDLVTPLVDWYTRDSRKIMHISPTHIEINSGGFFIYVKEIIRRILDEAGYVPVYSADINPDFFIIALACPITQFFEVFELGELSFDSRRQNSIDQTVNNATERVLMQLETGGSTDKWNSGASQFEFVNTVEITVTLVGVLDHIEVGTRPASTVTIFHNLNIIDQFSIDDDATDLDFRLTATINVLDGDIVYAEIHSEVIQTSLTLQQGTNFNVATIGVVSGRSVQPADWIPQINKSDFIANMLKLFNVVLIADDITNEIYFEPFNKIFTAQEQNITNLLDVGFNKIITKNSLSSLGQVSTFKWGNDNLLRRDTEYSLTIKNQILEKDVTVIEMDFSAVDESIYYTTEGFDRVGKIPNMKVTREPVTGCNIVIQASGQYVLDVEQDFQINQWIRFYTSTLVHVEYRITEVSGPTTGKVQTPIDSIGIIGLSLVVSEKITGEANDPEPRLALIEPQDDSWPIEAFHATDGTPAYGTGNFTAFPIDGLTAYWHKRLTWEEIVKNGDYKQIMGALGTPEVITAWFNLAAAVFFELDFLRPVYIEEFNAHYYINKIEQFKLESKTRLQLIRLSSIEE